MHKVMGNSASSLETPAPLACFSAIHSSQEIESRTVSNGWRVDTENVLCVYIVQIQKLACVCAVEVSTTEDN